LRRPSATGRIEFSARLLLNSSSGCSRKGVSQNADPLSCHLHDGGNKESPQRVKRPSVGRAGKDDRVGTIKNLTRGRTVALSGLSQDGLGELKKACLQYL
jgi:hypothetical protein